MAELVDKDRKHDQSHVFYGVQRVISSTRDYGKQEENQSDMEADRDIEQLADANRPIEDCVDLGKVHGDGLLDFLIMDDGRSFRTRSGEELA